jgi:hypothetical protein
MVFLFILDVVTSLTLRIVVNCGFWIVCKSANGVHYIYKKIMPPGGDERPSNPSSKEGVQGGGHASPSTPSSKEGCGRFAVPLVPGEEYIIIPRDEYERLTTGGGINVVA